MSKEELLRHLEAGSREGLLSIEEAHKRLVEFCRERKVGIPDRDSWVIFLNFDKTQNRQFSAEHLARVVFDETERDFLDRHVRARAFTGPTPQTPLHGKEATPKSIPDVVGELEVRGYDQKKSHWTMFQKLDTDGDGSVSADELKRFVERVTGKPLTEDKAKEVLEHFGVTEAGSVSFADFYGRLYQNIRNTDLMEREEMTNVMHCRQFDSRRYKDGYPALKRDIEALKDGFRLHGNDNRWLIRLLHARPIQVYAGVPEHLRQPPAAPHQRPVHELPGGPPDKLSQQGRLRRGRPSQTVGSEGNGRRRDASEPSK